MAGGEPELTLPAATDGCPTCRRVYHRPFACCGRQSMPIDRERSLSRWLNQPWEPPAPAEEDWHEHISRAYRAGWDASAFANFIKRPEGRR
jgi:hypothetical protein